MDFLFQVVQFLVHFIQVRMNGRQLQLINTHHYRSSGKVMFSVVSVCHSVHGGSHVTITHNALNLTVESPSDMGPPAPVPAPPSSITGDLFKLVNLATPHPPPSEVFMVGKLVVRILLECFLVLIVHNLRR